MFCLFDLISPIFNEIVQPKACHYTFWICLKVLNHKSEYCILKSYTYFHLIP